MLVDLRMLKKICFFVDNLLTSNSVIVMLKGVLLILITFLLANGNVYAQPEVQFNQLVFNQAIINPGYAGSDKDGLFNIIAFNRNQTAGFEGSPVTTAISVNGPLDIAGINSGVSLSLFYDKAGYLSTPGFNLGYAYRFKVSKGMVGVGLSLGMLLSSLDPEGWRLPEGSNEDPAIPTQKTSKTSFDAGLGAYYADNQWSFGVSCMHLTQPSITNVEKESKLKPEFYLSVGYKFALPGNANIELNPSVLISTDFAATQYVLNAQILFKKKFWAGVACRLNNSVGAMIGLNLFKNLKIGYSYDYSTSSLSKFSSGSHELMLSYSFALTVNKGKQKFKSIRYL
ncbi:MAG: PorP/SprF family type IX secretion system membrane protein [Prevotellaceae bacterium]|jgi:type IX secretion system PorP/SprF family membrane protein|nr:PorP/SprF family type IX secretion system membrane protein [Prevotellaceae bacterium]